MKINKKKVIYRNTTILFVTMKFAMIANFNQTNTNTFFQTCYAKKIKCD